MPAVDNRLDVLPRCGEETVGKIKQVRVRMARAFILLLLFTLTASAFGSINAQAQEQISSLVLNKNEINLEVGATSALTATAVYVSGTTENVTVKTDWNSGDPDVASVYAGSVTAKKEGKTVITSTYMGKTVIVNVSVTKRVRSLLKDKQIVELRQDQSEQIKLTAYYDDGTSEDVTAKADWNIDNGSIATVVNGKVTGQSSGSTNITAKNGGRHYRTGRVEVGQPCGRRCIERQNNCL